MSEFTTKSGAAVVVTIAPWQNAKTLKQAIQSEAAAAGIKINLDADVSTFVSAILKVDSSPVVDAALWPCLARCTYNGAKITEALFDSAESRADYYEVVIACVKENLGPLVNGLFSALPWLKELVKVTAGPSQNSPASTVTTPPS